MIKRNELELQARYYGKKIVSKAYKGTKLIWEAISSCFGSGMWINKHSWINNNTWKN